jgi:hypothetical protein
MSGSRSTISEADAQGISTALGTTPAVLFESRETDQP